MRLNLKQIIITAAAIILACGAAVLFLYNRDDGPKEGTAELGAYSCVWEKQSRDVLRLEVLGELPENARWSMLSSSGIIEAEQQEGNAVFTVRGLNEGSGSLSVYMRESGYPFEKGVDFSFGFTVNERRQLGFEGGSAETHDAQALGYGEDKEIYYQLGAAGSVFLYIKGTDWRVDSVQGLGYAGLTADGEWMRLEIYSMDNAGEKSIVVVNAEGEGFELALTPKDGALDIAGCSAAKVGEKAAEETDPEYDEFIAAWEAAETDEERDRLVAEYWSESVKKIN